MAFGSGAARFEDLAAAATAAIGVEFHRFVGTGCPGTGVRAATWACANAAACATNELSNAAIGTTAAVTVMMRAVRTIAAVRLPWGRRAEHGGRLQRL